MVFDMLSIQSALAPVLAHFPAPLLLVALLAVSLVMIFAGRTLAKVVAFLALGLVGAAFGASLAAEYLSPAWGIVGLLLGFAIGGLLGVVLLPVGVGLAVGYAGYLIATDFALGTTFALIVGVAFFVVGALLSGKILSIATAVVGGLLLFGILTQYGFAEPLATLVAGALALVGLFVQLGVGRAPQQSAEVGGQNASR
jgi:hypothetical protein